MKNTNVWLNERGIKKEVDVEKKIENQHFNKLKNDNYSPMKTTTFDFLVQLPCSYVDKISDHLVKNFRTTRLGTDLLVRISDESLSKARERIVELLEDAIKHIKVPANVKLEINIEKEDERVIVVSEKVEDVFWKLVRGF